MQPPSPSAKYDPSNEGQFRQMVALADGRTLKVGETIRLRGNQRIVLEDEDTGDLYRLKVASGVLSIVAYP